MIHMYNETNQPPEPYFGWGRVCRGRIWPLNIWGPSLLGAEFVRGRVCQGPSLLGAEMSRNQAKGATSCRTATLDFFFRSVTQ